MKIITFSVLIFVFQGVVFAEGCVKPCTRIYNPVCAFDGTQYKIFSNECMMKNEHCLDGHNWQQTTEMHKCEADSNDQNEILTIKNDCIIPCTFEFIPVCGYDGKQYKIFPNKCELENEHCRNGREWIGVNYAKCEAKNSKFNKKSKVCETPCTRELNPVCGKSGENYKIFSNPCVLRNQHCRDGKTWLQVIDANCDIENNFRTSMKINECQKICPMNIDPVCAFDGQEYRVFDNECMMNLANCKEHRHFSQVSRSLCDTEYHAKKHCETPCTLNYDPICGYNGKHFKIFSNLCELNNGHCQDGRNWIQIKMLHCEKKFNEA